MAIVPLVQPIMGDELAHMPTASDEQLSRAGVIISAGVLSTIVFGIVIWVVLANTVFASTGGCGGA